MILKAQKRTHKNFLLFTYTKISSYTECVVVQVLGRWTIYARMGDRRSFFP